MKLCINSDKELYLDTCFEDDLCHPLSSVWDPDYCLIFSLNPDAIFAGYFPKVIKSSFVWVENSLCNTNPVLKNSCAFAKITSQWVSYI